MRPDRKSRLSVVQEIWSFLGSAKRYYLLGAHVNSASNDRTADKYSNWSGDKTADKSADKTADRSADRSADWSADRSADWSADWSADKTADRSADKTADRSADRTAEYAKWSTNNSVESCLSRNQW